MRFVTLLILTLILAVSSTIYGHNLSASTVTTIFIVRHAEKSASPPDNPPLSAEGSARVESLTKMLGSAGIKAIYSSPFDRTRQTVEPLAKKLGLSIKQIDAKDIKGLVNRVLTENAGENILISGHSNTVPQIIEAFGAGPIPAISDNEYDNLFIVTVYETGKAKVLTLKY